MAVALTEHHDRGRHLLKGTEGTIVGLWMDSDETAPLVGDNGEAVLKKQPLAVLVQFPNIAEPVKIPLRSSRWCLNPSQKAKRQQVWVTRKQLPIVPAYAITAHSSQGKTLAKAIVDLRIPRTFSPIAAYKKTQNLFQLITHAPQNKPKQTVNRNRLTLCCNLTPGGLEKPKQSHGG